MDPDTDFDELIDRCTKQGWQLQIPDSVRRQWRYFSGTDQERVSDLQEAWTDRSIDGVLYLGGGWGGARILEAGFRFPRRPLWSVPCPLCRRLPLRGGIERGVSLPSCA